MFGYKSMVHARTKHIAVMYHVIRAAIDDRLILLNKISTEQNPMDALIK